jgi:hypothetical protein
MFMGAKNGYVPNSSPLHENANVYNFAFKQNCIFPEDRSMEFKRSILVQLNILWWLYTEGA